MTLSQIMMLALRQLDEDAHDLSEYESAFRIYANIGYDVAVREYLKPKEWYSLRTDGRGEAVLPGGNVLRVVRIEDGRSGKPLSFCLLEDGSGVRLCQRDAPVRALCEVCYEDMTLETDEPRLPARVHPALADYICYRHLSCGSMAKQARAQAFLTSFNRAMRSLRPQGMGGVRGYRGLYAATDIRGSGVAR